MRQQSSSSRPKALISRSALMAAASVAVDAGGRVADLRGDAWGHGLVTVAQAVSTAGAHAVLVDSADEVEALRTEGIAAVADRDADIDSHLLYGLPFADGVLRTNPVMRLTGRVLSTKRLKAGDAVSYGYAYRTERDTTVALVTGGYAQGIMRSLGNKAHVDIGSMRRPVVGRIAMDVCVVDLQGHGHVAVGTEVTYFGGTGTAAGALAEWKSATGLGTGELVTVAGAHADREWEA